MKQPSLTLLYAIVAIGLISLLALIMGLVGLSVKQKAPAQDKVTIVYDISDPYSESKLIDYLKDLNVKYPLIALSQMKLESANGTSPIFKKNNNLFGMKMPGTRPTTALGIANNHAKYAHWRQSVIDYAMWQAYVMNTENVSSEDAWLEYINRFYSEIPGEYKRRILEIKLKLNPTSL